MRIVKSLAVSLLATIVLVASAPAASAESVTVRDPTGDAPRAVDVSRVRVMNAQPAVRIQMHFADLQRSRVQAVKVELDVGKLLGRGYVIVFKRRESGGFAKQLSWVRLYSEGSTTLRCAGLKLVWAAPDGAVVRLPRTCMTKPHDQRVRANVRVVSRSGKRDRIPDKFLSFSPWVSRG